MKRYKGVSKPQTKKAWLENEVSHHVCFYSKREPLRTFQVEWQGSCGHALVRHIKQTTISIGRDIKQNHRFSFANPHRYTTDIWTFYASCTFVAIALQDFTGRRVVKNKTWRLLFASKTWRLLFAKQNMATFICMPHFMATFSSS